MSFLKHELSFQSDGSKVIISLFRAVLWKSFACTNFHESMAFYIDVGASGMPQIGKPQLVAP